MSPSEDRTEELAQRIRYLRKAAGLTGSQFAELIGVSQSKISKIETGRLLPTLEDVENIVEMLDLSARQRKQLVTLTESVLLQLDRLRVGAVSTFKSRQAETARIESEAKEIRVFNPYSFPGLLQTADFARQLLQKRFSSEQELDEAVAVRMARQQALYDSKRTFRFVLGEPCFRWQVADLDTTEAQALHVLQLSSLRNIDVRLLSFATPPPVIPHGSFAIYDETLVTVETFSAELTLKDAVDVEDFSKVFDDLRRVAQTGNEMKTTIDAALATWE